MPWLHIQAPNYHFYINLQQARTSHPHMHSTLQISILFMYLIFAGILALFCSGLAAVPQFNYTYQMFVITWPHSYCQQRACRHGWNNWDGRSFVVHGLWPSSTDRGFGRQMIRGDNTCRSNATFNINALPVNLQNTLTRVMPGLSRQPRDFWRHEYQKHGSCQVMLSKNAGAAPPENQLMVSYFQQIVNLYNAITGRFRLTKGHFANTGELAQALHLRPNTFIAIVKNGNLAQLKICLAPSRLSSAAPPRLIPCPNHRPHNGVINLPGFRPTHHFHLAQHPQQSAQE